MTTLKLLGTIGKFRAVAIFVTLNKYEMFGV